MFEHSGFKALIAAMALCFTGAVAHAGVVLNIDAGNGKLRGASGLVVGSKTYTVEFVEGTCAQVYGACELSKFVANDYNTAALFGAALLRDVFVDTYDTTPSSTYGCTTTLSCDVLTAYGKSDSVSFFAMARNAAREPNDGVFDGGILLTGNTQSLTRQVWARWTQQPTASVPEPSTWALLAVAGAACAGAQRRRRDARLAH